MTSKALVAGIPDDDEDTVMMEVPLFERTHAPRTSGSGPGHLRSVDENDFARGLRTGLALFEPTVTVETSSSLLWIFFLADGGAISFNWEVEDKRS